MRRRGVVVCRRAAARAQFRLAAARDCARPGRAAAAAAAAGALCAGRAWRGQGHAVHAPSVRHSPLPCACRAHLRVRLYAALLSDPVPPSLPSPLRCCAAFRSKDYGFVHLSAGDLLREERERGGEVGELIESMIREGACADCRLPPPVDTPIKI